MITLLALLYGLADVQVVCQGGRHDGVTYHSSATGLGPARFTMIQGTGQPAQVASVRGRLKVFSTSCQWGRQICRDIAQEN